MGKTHNITRQVRDQAPHYPFLTAGLREVHQVTTTVTTGSDRPHHHYPRHHQGVNSGLLLVDLGRVRRSEEFQEELEVGRMEAASQRILSHPDWSLGDQVGRNLPPDAIISQEWLSLLSWTQPHLVSLLPCSYNVLQCSTTTNSSLLLPNSACGLPTLVAHYCGIEVHV